MNYLYRILQFASFTVILILILATFVLDLTTMVLDNGFLSFHNIANKTAKYMNNNNTDRTRNTANISDHHIGSSISSKNEVRGTTSSPNKSPCCYTTSLKYIDGKFTDQYFENQRKIIITSHLKWSGNEAEEWQLIRSKMMNSNTFSVESCAAHWIFTYLDGQNGADLRGRLNDLLKWEGTKEVPSFGYAPPSPYPKCLVLGDSISRGITLHTQPLARQNNLKLSIQGAPTNCGVVGNYKKRLSTWLGTCEWDLVQFNIGMHWHGVNNVTDYTHQLAWVVNEIRTHSPAAHVVFALTTPSPFDSNDTWPNKETCNNYDKFHKSGFVPTINNAASVSLRKMNVTINDRYSIVQPELGRYQHPCDIHYTTEGYKFMASHDLEFFSNALGIKGGS